MKKYLIYLTIFLIVISGLIIIFNSAKKNDEDTLKEILFNVKTINLELEEEYQLEIKYIPASKKEEITYLISDNSIISIDNIGSIKALKEGIAIVTAISESGIKAELEVIVTKSSTDSFVEVEEIMVDKTELILDLGTTYQLKLSFFPSSSTDKKIIWENTNDKVVTVSDTHLISAKTEGTAILTAYTSNKKKVSVTVKVVKPTVKLQSFELSPNILILEVGDNYRLKPILIPSNVTDKTVTYTSSNHNIVSVDSSGNVKAIGKGECVITAISNDKVATSKITVRESTNNNNNNNPILTESIFFTNAITKMKVNETYQLRVGTVPGNASNKKYTWSSSDKTIATVSNGLIKAIKPGVVTITAKTTNNKTVSVKITISENNPVKPIVPTKVLLNFSTVTIKVGETKELKATVLPSNAPQNVEWVAGSDIVTVNNGLITGKKVGNTTVAAITPNGKVAKIKVTVTFANITPETASKKFGIQTSMKDGELKQINTHMSSYIEEYLKNYNGSKISEKRIRTLAAAYFLTYNPYYRICYYRGDISLQTIGKGWDIKWSTARSSGAGHPHVGLDSYSFLVWAIYQGTDKTVKISPNEGIIRYSNSKGIPINEVVMKGKPGDILIREGDSKRYAMIYSINKDGSITIIHSDGITNALCMATYKNNTTLKFNLLYSMSYIYGD